jgi:outer membrane receptor for ferrienterochelin and colicin
MQFVPANPEEINNYGQKNNRAEVNLTQNLTPKSGAFVNYKQRFWHRLVANLGLRYDYFKLLDTHSLSPRFSLSYDVTDRLTLQTGIGRYFQSPELVNISADPSNRENLRDFSCDHVVAGLSYLLTPSTRLTLEVYHKQYDHYPVLADSGYEMLSLANSGADYGGNYLNRLTAAGEGRADGIELMLQKKLAENLYGLVSYSYSEIKHQARDGVLRNGAFDNRQVFNLVLGYRLNKSWEFSTKWRYAGGAPYTPFDRAASIAANDGRLDLTRINAERFDPYHRLDLRFDHRTFYKSGTLVSYLSIENVYNRENMYSPYWNNTQQKTKFTYQTGIFVVGGVSFEF